MGDCDRTCRCCDKGDELRTITLDFGKVPVDTTVVKAVKIRNDNCSEESYEVLRDPMTNPLDIVFHIDKYSWSLHSNRATICHVQYQPILPSQTSVDYFTIVNCGIAVLKIIVQGESIGPNAIISPERLVMICAPGESIRKRVKITNDSNASANFSFDVDERQNFFKPEPIDGCIAPHSHMYIIINFRPAFEGPHVSYLPCLVHHQAPIMILLNGYCGTQYASDNIPTLVYPPQERDGFQAYMSDSHHLRLGKVQQRDSSAPDLVSLTNNYIDFGRIVPGSHNSILRSPLTTCFTNHSTMDMLVKWHEDVDGIFSLKPNKTRVGAEETCLFEVRFDPENENEFYSREMTVLAHWVLPDQSVPISLYSMITSIHLMGHTFPPGSSSWIPQYEIPQAVVMPPSLPSSSVYTTFIIRKSGHLPMMFRFMPPEETHFSVKPKLGVIYKNYQVIVVEMFPVGHSKLLYERWSIILNGNPEYEVFMDFRGYTEYLCLSFSSELVTFFPTHPGCEQIKHVAVRNPTRHCIAYWFDDSSSVLNIDRVRGQINSNEIIIHNWIFCPPEEGDYEFFVDCFTTAAAGQENCEIIKLQLHVLGTSEKGNLLATPNELNFGKQACDEARTLSFRLINPGPVEIPYMLTLKHQNWPYEEQCIEQININPTSGILGPAEEENIELYLLPLEAGLHELSIQYSIRRNWQMDEILPTKDPLEICKIKYFCVLPVIKVEDLLQYRTGPNMSKYVLWRLLKIKKLNKILNNLQRGERGDLEMSLPPMILQDDNAVIKLLISNPTSAVATWSFKQIKLCNCSKTSEKRGLSLHYLKYNCSHRSLCMIYPKSGSLKAHEKTTITMELHYTTLGETKLEWDLDLGHDRHICLVIKMTGLSGLETIAIPLYGPHLQLKEIYIGDRDPINQICWIYNPTRNDITYSVDTTAFKRINKNHGCKIFSCFNPSGTIRALSREPVFIKFQPRQWGIFEVEVGLTLGSEKAVITIKGESTNNPLIKISPEISPIRDILRIPEVPIYFNTDHFTLPPIPMHSRATRLVMVHNHSQSEVIAYKWKRSTRKKSCKVDTISCTLFSHFPRFLLDEETSNNYRYKLPGIIELDVQPKTARIQPGTLHTHRLIIHTGGQPCRINADITCEFINQSRKRAYEKSVLMHNSLCEEMKHHFTITEKGTTVPKPKATVLEAPKAVTKMLTVRCYIYSPQDEVLKTRRKERLKNTPPLEISMERRSGRISATKDTITLSQFVLERMIWEILQNTNLSTLPNSDIKYSQIKMNPQQRERLKERSYTRPSGRMIERILENMIFMIVHKEFALNVIHLTQTSDARQVAYQKMWQQVPHQKDKG